MATPTTLLELATEKQLAARTAVKDAQQRLAQAQEAIVTERNKLTRAAEERAGLDIHAAEIRKKLPAIPTAADGQALLDALEQVIIRSRTEQALILKAQTDLGAAQSDADGAQADLTAASARLATTESDLTQARQADKQRSGWKTALAAAPLATIKADAITALAAPPFIGARKRIEADFPAKLLARARDRRSNESAVIAQAKSDTLAAENAALHERHSNGGLAGKAAKLWTEFLRAAAVVRDFVESAPGRFDQAIAVLAQVADSARAPLTPEQTARINESTLKVAREAAADDEKIRDDKSKDVAAKRVARDLEILKAKAAGENPDDVTAVQNAKKDLTDAEKAFKTADDAWRAREIDRDTKLGEVEATQAALAKAIQDAIAAKKNPDTDTKVAGARTLLTKSQSELKAAEDEYKKSRHGILHAWEAAVPETTWRLLEDFERATQMLTDLKDSDSTAIVTALDSAETAYVKARREADASASVIEQLAAEDDHRAARQQILTQAASSRLFGALRGDN